MYILNIAKTIKKITVKELKDFIFESYLQRMRFAKESSYYSAFIQSLRQSSLV